MATLTTYYQRIGTSTYTVVGSNELRLYAKYNSQSIANNNSNISVQLRTIALSGNYYSTGNSSTLTCVGGRGTQYYDIGTVTTSSEKTIGTWTFDLSHSSSGTLTGVSASASANVYGSLNPSVSGSFDLPSIPRQANILSAPNFNTNENPTITYSNPAGNNVTSLQACIANNTGGVVFASYRDISKTGSSYTFYLTQTEKNAIRNASSNNQTTVRFYIKTVIGGNTYYSYLERTATAVYNKATITSASNFNTNQNPTVYYSNTEGTNVTELKMCMINPSDTITFANYRDVSITGSSYTFNLTESERDSIRNNSTNNKITVRYVLRTLINGSYQYSSYDVVATAIYTKAEILTAQDFTDEGNPTITYTNPEGNKVTYLQACIANTSGSAIYAPYRNVNKTGTLSYTFNLTTEERNILRQTCTGKSLNIRFYIKTIIGGNTYYSYVQKTMSITNAIPDLTYTAVETDEDVIEILGTNELLIKNITKPQITLTGTAKKYATITSYEMNLNGEYYGGYQHTFDKLTNNNLYISTIDSRGLKNEQNVALNIIDYFEPNATIEVPRAEQDNDNAYINIDGNWYNEGFGEIDNELTITWEYREDGIYEWTYGGTITPTISGNTFSTEDYLLGDFFSYAKEYKIKVTITDLFSSVEYIATRQKNKYSLKDTYYVSDILTYEDMIGIEDYIEEAFNLLNKQTGTSYVYTKQEWYKNSAMLVSKLNHIEEAIRNLGRYYFKPHGWQNPKTWKTDKPERFDYTDVNRWIIDLNLITERLYNESSILYPADDLYPNDTLYPR